MQTTELDDAVPGLAMAREWPALMFVGVITVIMGVIVLAWPSQTLAVISVLIGIQFIVFGLFRLIEAFAGETAGVVGFVGVLLMISGVIVLRNPYETVAILATILGVVWIVSGSIDVVAAIADRESGGRGPPRSERPGRSDRRHRRRFVAGSDRHRHRLDRRPPARHLRTDHHRHCLLVPDLGRRLNASLIAWPPRRKRSKAA